MSFLLGLTGSIGMGKSTTAQMFHAEGVPVWDADAVVATLYAKDGAAVGLLKSLNADLVTDGAVDRTALKAWIKSEPKHLSRLESIIHPLVAQDRETFIADHADHDLILCDIPLLFETKAEEWLDAVLVVTTDFETQRSRVMARDGMDLELFNHILNRQMSDAEKIKRADYVIKTNSYDQTRVAVRSLIKDLQGKI